MRVYIYLCVRRFSARANVNFPASADRKITEVRGLSVASRSPGRPRACVRVCIVYYIRNQSLINNASTRTFDRRPQRPKIRSPPAKTAEQFELADRLAHVGIYDDFHNCPGAAIIIVVVGVVVAGRASKSHQRRLRRRVEHAITPSRPLTSRPERMCVCVFTWTRKRDRKQRRELFNALHYKLISRPTHPLAAARRHARQKKRATVAKYMQSERSRALITCHIIRTLSARERRARDIILRVFEVGAVMMRRSCRCHPGIETYAKHTATAAAATVHKFIHT